jgi:hypothetical protein
MKTITVRDEGTVQFAEISAPPINLVRVAHRIASFPAAGHVAIKAHGTHRTPFGRRLPLR